MRLAKPPKTHGLLSLASLACLATTVACATGGGPPTLNGLTDQVAQVGTELKIELDASSSSGGRLAYKFHAADVTDLDGHAAVTIAPSGAGIFRWTPLAADLGNHAFDFTASDGNSDTTVTINIDVKSAIGSGTAPIFRQPLGTGTTIDLTHTMCVDLDVVVEDQVNATVKINQEAPVIDGAKLTASGGQTAKWHWCPTVAQQADMRYTLVLSADDGTNPKTIKDYLIVLRGASGTSCPGSGPTIAHTPADQTTRLDLAPSATIADPAGLKDTPLFYYSTTNPGASPDLSMMTQLTAVKTSGDSMNGQYAPDVPNPVAAAADGTSATLYYVFVADDHDAANNCDHTTQSPVYQMMVTAGGTTTAGLCQTCTADSQCGIGNECVYMGSMGNSYCLAACTGGCATGYSCSASPIYSVDFAQANQCVPQSGSCIAPTGTCDNDAWDPNQTMTDASANGPMSAGSYSLVSCPDPNSTTRAENDWFKIVVPTQSHVDIYLSGDGSTDLDLHLYHSDGTTVDAALGLTDQEQLHDCVAGLTYYIKVNGYGYARDAYSLTWSSTPTASCP